MNVLWDDADDNSTFSSTPHTSYSHQHEDIQHASEHIKNIDYTVRRFEIRYKPSVYLQYMFILLPVS